MANQRISALIFLTVITMAIGAVVLGSGILFGSRTITNQGNVNAIRVGVYSEASCTNNISSINWGYIEPGSTKNFTIYIRNEGNLPMTLNMTTEGWNPNSTSTYISLRWNREASLVAVNSVVETVLTLLVSPDIAEITDFAFDITIIGSESPA